MEWPHTTCQTRTKHALRVVIRISDRDGDEALLDTLLIFDASCSQPSHESWAMQRVSIQRYRKPSFAVMATALRMVCDSWANGRHCKG
jgi:hypothetical protein